MTRNQLMWTAWVCTLATMATTASALDTYLKLDVVAGDPNTPTPLIEATGGQEIEYHITALVCTDLWAETVDANYTKGLGAAYLTLNTDFVDPNLVDEPNGIHATLSVYPSTGLPLADDVTDIGGSQDLLGDGSTPVEFANGQREVIASGRIRAPSADGVYHVWVSEQQVAALEPNLTTPPFGYEPNLVKCGQGFYVVVGSMQYHTLGLYIVNDNYGEIEVVPNLPNYPSGMEVTLAAYPHYTKHFLEWREYDPNDNIDPNDSNYLNNPDYYTVDANNPMTLVRDQDRLLIGVFKCGSAIGPTIPL